MEIKGLGQNSFTSIGNDTEVKVQPKKEVVIVNKQSNSNGKEKEYTEKDLKKAVEKLNKFLEDDNTHAEYNVHDKFGDIMIKVIDNTTKEVILEVPPKKILDMVAKLCEMVGIVFDKKA